MKKYITLFLTAYLSISGYSQSRPILLGYTPAGGAYRSGTIIRYNGGDSVLSGQFNFPAGTNVSSPTADDSYGCTLTLAPDGKMYGLNPFGDSLSTLFEYDYATNTQTVKVVFDSAHGYGAMGCLLMATNGIFYGVCSNGGAYNGGTLFSYLTGDSSVTKLVDLPAGISAISYLVQAANGKIYGMTTSGGSTNAGTIFQYDITTGTDSFIFSLPFFSQPVGGLIQVGADTLYGTTQFYDSVPAGAIFQYAVSSGTYTVLHTFGLSAYPASLLLHATDGKLYGTTQGDGANGAGTLYSYDIAAAAYTDVYDFPPSSLSTNGLIQASDGMLYGMNNVGGPNNLGSIFKYDIGSGIFTNEINFDSASGYYPQFEYLTEYLPAAPVISAQPSGITVCAGDTASYSISDSGSVSGIQWQVSADSGMTYTDIPGANDSVYTFTAAYADSGYYFRSIITNGTTYDTSAAAPLTVYAPAIDTIATTICAGDSFVYNGISLYPGTYTNTLPAASVHGCDSTVILQVAVYAPAADSIAATICAGDSFTYNGRSYYSGSYADTLPAASVHGCDSIVTIQVSVYAPAIHIITGSICAGDSFILGQAAYYTTGSHNDTLAGSSAHGCDSTVILLLTVYPPALRTVTDTICQGQGFTFGTDTFTTSGIYTDTIHGASVHGCDSMIALSLTVSPLSTPMVTITSTNTSDTICDNTVVNLFATATDGGINPDYQWQRNGTNVGNSATYIANPVLNGDIYTCILTSTATCVAASRDTSNAVTFTVIPYPSVTVSLSRPTAVCAGDSVVLTAAGGSSYVWSTGDSTAAIYATGGSYTVTATGAYGCTAGSVPYTVSPPVPLTDSISQSGDSLVSAPSQFYQWYYDDSIISGATGPVYIPMQTGDYQVAVIDSFGCIAYSSVEYITISTGIHSIPATAMSIYPNPAAGSFTLLLSDQSPHIVSITDDLGRTVADGITVTHQRRFDLPGLTDGMYYLHIDGSAQAIKFSIVK